VGVWRIQMTATLGLISSKTRDSKIFSMLRPGHTAGTFSAKLVHNCTVFGLIRHYRLIEFFRERTLKYPPSVPWAGGGLFRRLWAQLRVPSDLVMPPQIFLWPSAQADSWGFNRLLTIGNVWEVSMGSAWGVVSLWLRCWIVNYSRASWTDIAGDPPEMRMVLINWNLATQQRHIVYSAERWV
jgi:hypothetical protein